MSKLQTRQCNNTNNNNIFAHLFLVVLPRFVVVVCFSALPSWSRPSILLLLFLLLAHFYCYPVHSHPVSIYTLLFGNISHLILIAKSLFLHFLLLSSFQFVFCFIFSYRRGSLQISMEENLLHTLFTPLLKQMIHRPPKKQENSI